MKRFVSLLALAVALSGPAHAIPEVIVPGMGQAPTEEQTPHEPEEAAKLDHWAFKCVPEEKPNKGDSDPVVRVYVTADFEKSDWGLKNLTVQHETYSGKVYDRGDQYDTTKDYGRADNKWLWLWNGILKGKPSHTITGGLFVTTDKKWHYGERHVTTIKKHENVSWFWTACTEVKDSQ